MTYDPASANPLAGNPLKTRSDMIRAVNDLFDPLLPFFSDGNARVRLDGAPPDLGSGICKAVWSCTDARLRRPSRTK